MSLRLQRPVPYIGRCEVRLRRHSAHKGRGSQTLSCSPVGTATALLLAALIGAYAVNVTTGLPWLSDGPEPVDLVGLVTKSVEGVGLLFSIQLTAIRGGFDSLTHKEARP